MQIFQRRALRMGPLVVAVPHQLILIDYLIESRLIERPNRRIVCQIQSPISKTTNLFQYSQQVLVEFVVARKRRSKPSASVKETSS